MSEAYVQLWEGYVDLLMSDDRCRDAAIVEHKNEKKVLASFHQGIFGGITSEEIDQFVREDRGDLFVSGVTLAGKKCVVLRDTLWKVDGMMDLKMMDDEKTDLCISVAKTYTMLVVVMGKRDVPGGAIHDKAFEMAKKLRENNL